MDREISKKSQNKAIAKKAIYFGLVILGIYLLYFFTQKLLTRNADSDQLVIAKVLEGDIENRLTASGQVIPYYERVINAPVATEITTVYLQSGASIQKGDLIMELDQEFTRLEFDQLKDELEVRANNITKLKLEYDKNLRDLDYRTQIKSLEVDELKAQVVDQKRLKEIGGATAEEVEKAQLQLSVAQLEQKILENELEYRKESNETEKENLELEYKIQEKKLSELRRKLRETTVVAPDDGVITWINEDLGKKLQAGEQIVKIANLDRFKINASVSDRYSSRISAGIPVSVRVENQRVGGVISNVLPAIENNTIQFSVTLNDEHSKLLRSNMRVEVYIITDRKENILKIRNGNAFSGASLQEVFVVEDNIARKVQVTIGLRNSEFVEISGNVRPGDQIITSETKDFDHLDQFTINQ